MRVFQARRREPHNFDAFYGAFSTVMVFLATIWVFADVMLGHKMWLLPVGRNYPGGPMAYMEAHPSLAGTIAIFILQQMTDGLMVRPSGSICPADMKLTSSVPDLPLSNRVGQPSCYHYTLHPVACNVL